MSKLTKDQFEGILRHALTLMGSVVLVFFSDADTLVGEIIASAMMLGGVFWSILKKEGLPLQDKVRGVVNHSIAIVSALLIYFGKTDLNDTMTTVAAALINLLPFVLSIFDKKDNG